MKIAIVTIGDELLAGKIQNTNARDIGALVRPYGQEVALALTLPDDKAAIVTGFQWLSDPARGLDLVLVTGGLGPTADDLTREACGEFLGQGLHPSSEALEALSSFLGRNPDSLSAGQRVQALLPVGSSMLRNPAGTACGFEFRRGETAFMVFPGVPRELREMMGLHLLPRLGKEGLLLERKAWTYGLSESDQKSLFAPLDLPPHFFFSSLPGERGVLLSLSTRAPSDASLPDAPTPARREAELEALWQRLLSFIPPAKLVDPMGRSLPQAVQHLLRIRNLRIVTAESCTAGALSFLLTEEPGSSALFHQGFITYANAVKSDWLGVEAATLERFGAVSEEVVREMAAGALARSTGHIACAISGIAGPDGGSAEKPVGTVWLAVGGGGRFRAKRLQLRGTRQEIRWHAAYAALDFIRLFLLEPASLEEGSYLPSTPASGRD